MRLIDADELLQKFKYSDAHTEDENVWCVTFRRMIKEQPTAYNIDKVVEELGNQEGEYQQFDMPTNEYESGFEYGCEYAFRKATEIVKSGGRK